jgi:transcription antitermination factor NusG
MATKAKEFFAWYIVQTKSGTEKQVAADILQRARNLQLTHLIKETRVPEKDEIVTRKDGTEVIKKVPTFPRYVYVYMCVNDATWFAIRQAPNVTGFLGASGNRALPVPVTDAEMEIILGEKIQNSVNLEAFLHKMVEVDFGGTPIPCEVIGFDNDRQMLQLYSPDFPTLIPHGSEYLVKDVKPMKKQ